jgi:DNA transposition AAA+ family ATPase
MSSQEIVEAAKRGKIVVITSRSGAGKVTPKNPRDAERVAVVVVD